MKYKITEQEVSIGVIEKHYGEPETRLVDYDSIIDLLKGEGFMDDTFNADDGELEYDGIIEDLVFQGHFYTKDETMLYWPNPEKLDNRPTYATKYKIEEVSQEILDKMAAVRQKFTDSVRNKAKRGWSEFLKANAGKCNSDLLEELMENYEFPDKLEIKV